MKTWDLCWELPSPTVYGGLGPPRGVEEKMLPTSCLDETNRRQLDI